MKITILTSDFSGNSFGRAWVLANALKRNYAVEVVGPAFGGAIWEPLRNSCAFETRFVKAGNKGRFDLRGMLSLIRGDVVYASKPMLASFAVGLVKKGMAGTPLVLDIDDYESGFGKEFYNSLPFFKKINDIRLDLPNLRSRYYSVVLERLAWLADEVTVSGKTLQARYGGTVIWHARDEGAFCPEKVDRTAARAKYLNASERKYFVLGFIGSPRPHKGLEDLVEAVKLLHGKEIRLMLVGIKDDEYGRGLKRLIAEKGVEDKVKIFPERPFAELPEFLAAMDLITIPQSARAASSAQVPAKLFDAMAMGKPILSTAISDIPEILSGCGWVTDPGVPDKLAETVSYIIANPSEAAAKGLAARRKFEREYSLDAVSRRLAEVFDKFEKRKWGK